MIKERLQFTAPPPAEVEWSDLKRMGQRDQTRIAPPSCRDENESAIRRAGNEISGSENMFK